MNELKRLLLEWAADFDGVAEYAPTRLEKVVLKTRAEECRKAAREQEGGEAVAEVVDKDQADEIGNSVVVELGGRVLLPGDRLYTRSPQPQIDKPESWWVNLIDRVVPDLSPEPDQNQYPAEWTLWADRQRIRRELAVAVLCTPAPPEQEVEL